MRRAVPRPKLRPPGCCTTSASWCSRMRSAPSTPMPCAKGFGDGRAIWQIEADAFGASHAEVGAYLLGLWGFPEADHRRHRVAPSAVGDRRARTAGADSGSCRRRDCASASSDGENRGAVRGGSPDVRIWTEIGLADAMPRWLESCTGREDRDA